MAPTPSIAAIHAALMLFFVIGWRAYFDSSYQSEIIETGYFAFVALGTGSYNLSVSGNNTPTPFSPFVFVKTPYRGNDSRWCEPRYIFTGISYCFGIQPIPKTFQQLHNIPTLYNVGIYLKLLFFPNLRKEC
jgi:hypothetical protein